MYTAAQMFTGEAWPHMITCANTAEGRRGLCMPSHTRTPTRAASAAQVVFMNNMEVVIRVYAFARGFTLGRA